MGRELAARQTRLIYYRAAEWSIWRDACANILRGLYKVDPALRGVSEHMRELGRGALMHANGHANYAHVDNPYWPELSVLQAAHAAEIFIKARIAQEHPLLIFESIPKAKKSKSPLLSFEQLIEEGRTIQYAELPDRLWAATGMRLPNLTVFERFGRLRNSVQHFAAPEGRDLSNDTLEFIFGVIDPFIHECWGLFAIDHNEDVDPHVYLIEGLVRREIYFLVSPGAAKEWRCHCDLAGALKKYLREMDRRVSEALSGLPLSQS